MTSQEEERERPGRTSTLTKRLAHTAETETPPAPKPSRPYRLTAGRAPLARRQPAPKA